MLKEMKEVELRAITSTQISQAEITLLKVETNTNNIAKVTIGLPKITIKDTLMLKLWVKDMSILSLVTLREVEPMVRVNMELRLVLGGKEATILFLIISPLLNHLKNQRNTDIQVMKTVVIAMMDTGDRLIHFCIF